MSYVGNTRLGRALGVVCAFTAACGDDAGSKAGGDLADAGSEQGTVEIYSWWTAGGEAQALADLIDEYKVRFSGRDVINSTSAASASGTVDEAIRVLKARLANDQPPDAWQTI